MIRLASAVLGGIVVLFVTQASFAFLTPPAPPPPATDLLPVLLSNALVIATLLMLARRMAVPPARRALTLFAIWGGIQTNSLIELFLFDIGITRAQTLGLIAYSLLQAAVTGACLGWLAPAAPPAAAPGTMRIRPGWLALAPPLYIVCYLTAGAIVWPFIADYYQARPMPAMAQVLALQVFRGLAFGAIVLLIVRACGATRLMRAGLAGLTLAVLGGAAPLVMPNALMPPDIRLAHFFEVVPSIFVFGSVLAWMLTRGARTGVSWEAQPAYPGDGG
jgi:hypothetical protein